VAPLVSAMRDEGLIQRFFFVRYAEGGLHVRLRFGGDGRVLQFEVRHRVDSAIRNYLANRPSEIEFTPDELRHLGAQWAEVDGDTPLPIQPNNSLLYIPYVPETSRYGGPSGVAIAEDHFDFSSTQALSVLLAEGQQATPEGRKAQVRRRLGIALQCSLVLPASFGCTRLQTRDLFARYQRTIVETYKIDRPPLFESQFLAQRDKLCSMAEAVLSNDTSKYESARCWHSHGTALLHRLLAAGLGGSAVHERAPFYSRILLSYLHMFCNRLAVFLEGEMYVSYLAERVCDTLMSSSLGADVPVHARGSDVL